jgi:tetratricopeptide (TPR) repeat protein
MLRQLLAVFFLILPACGSGAVQSHGAAGTQPRPEREQPTWLFSQGVAAADKGDSVRAEQYLSLALDHGYPRERVLPVLLKVCLASSRLRAALDHAEPYLREHPEQDALRFLVANIHVGLGQEGQALAELDRLLRHNPRFEEAHFLRGSLLLEGEPTQAVEAFRAYLDVAPRGPHAPEARSRLSDLLLREVSLPAQASTKLLEETP